MEHLLLVLAIAIPKEEVPQFWVRAVLMAIAHLINTSNSVVPVLSSQIKMTSINNQFFENSQEELAAF